MGTRSKTSFIEKRGDKLTHLVSIYQQYDGYIEGVGHEIANYILNKEIVNGIKLGDRETDKKANGFTCLIAQFIRDFKTEIGNLYITTENDIQEYNYDIIFNTDEYFNKGFFNDTVNTDEYFNKGFFNDTVNTDEYFNKGFFNDTVNTDEYFNKGFFNDTVNTDEYFNKGFFNDTVNTDEYFEVIVTDWNEQVIFQGTLKELLEFKESYDE